MLRTSWWRGVIGALLALGLPAACTSPPRVGDVLEPVATLKIEPRDAVQRVVVSPDGRYVAAKGFDRKTIYVWDVARRELVYRLPHSTAPESRLAFTPNGKYLYSGDRFPYQEQLIRDARGMSLRDAQDKERVRELKPEERFSAHLWDMETGEKTRTFYFERQDNVCWYTGTQFRADGKQFAEGNDRGIYLCDAESAKPIRFIPYPWMNELGRPRGEKGPSSYLGFPKAFVILPDWKTALVAAERHERVPGRDPQGYYEVILLWLDLTTGKITREATVTPKLFAVLLGFEIVPLALSQDGRTAAVGTWFYGGGEKKDVIRTRIKVFNTTSGEALVEVADASLQFSISNLSLDSSGTRLLVAGDRLTAWEVPSGRKLGEFKPASRHPLHVDFSIDGHTFVGGVEDMIYVWAVKNTEQMTRR